ncbi:MAG: hypothetical protein ACTHOR_05675, partial [Devosia sp.]
MALVVIGPKDLPIVMRKVGRVVGTIRRMGSEFQRELNKTTGLDQITDLKRQITEPLRQTSEEIAREFNKITTTGVEPSGAVKPDPTSGTVYETIAATSGLTPEPSTTAPAASPTATAASEPLPGPAETAATAAQAGEPQTLPPA